MLNIKWPAALVAAGVIALSAGTSLAGDAKGDWVRPNGASKIRIGSCGGALCGKLIWLKDPRNDTKNPDASKRDQPLLGVQIVKSMTPTANLSHVLQATFLFCRPANVKG